MAALGDLARLYTRPTGAPHDQLTRLSVRDEFRLALDRREARLSSRLVVRAEADRVARRLVGGGAPPPPRRTMLHVS